MEYAIQVENLTIIRQGKATLDDVSFSAEPGQQWAIVGPNGAGKSTLMSVIATATPPVRGTVKVLGHQVGTIELSVIREQLGYVTTHHQLDWPMNARDIVLTAFTNTLETPMRWQATPEQLFEANRQLEEFGLSEVAETHWRGLSQGELGKTLLARATLLSPTLLLLDEPAAGLDLAAREHILDVIEGLGSKNNKLTTVLITHHLEELPTTTTHAAVMKQGKIVHRGVAAEVLTSEILSEVFDTPIRVDYIEGRWSSRGGR